MEAEGQRQDRLRQPLSGGAQRCSCHPVRLQRELLRGLPLRPQHRQHARPRPQRRDRRAALGVLAGRGRVELLPGLQRPGRGGLPGPRRQGLRYQAVGRRAGVEAGRRAGDLHGRLRHHRPQRRALRRGAAGAVHGVDAGDRDGVPDPGRRPALAEHGAQPPEHLPGRGPPRVWAGALGGAGRGAALPGHAERHVRLRRRHRRAAVVLERPQEPEPVLQRRLRRLPRPLL
mmetsp:Transcript_92705/g.271391  ORF Transcript_92705/g.271391 Transcript_92705/m.271391 type:complete len:230 (-) Transcript_92705:589-1278(-)